MTDRYIAPNLLIFVEASNPERPKDSREIRPVVACEQCHLPVTNGLTAHVYGRDIEGPSMRTDAHVVIPFVIHDGCLGAFKDANAGQWLQLYTVEQFLRKLSLWVAIDEKIGRRAGIRD